QGKLHLERRPVDLAVVVGQTVETCRPLLDAKRHQLTASLPDEPVRLEADPTRLTQVLSNLLTNAAKYTPEGGHIWLSAEQQDGEVVVRVRDDGLGIPPEVLPRVFDLFVQAEDSAGHSHGGLGIGLALVKSLVEMHGGKVGVRSDGPGK